MTKINDLCSVLSEHCHDCFGFLDGDEHHFVVYPVSHVSIRATFSAVTLDKVL
jgi:hypothetical protein